MAAPEPVAPSPSTLRWPEGQAPRVNIQQFENLQNLIDVLSGIVSPLNDIEIFAAGLDADDDELDEFRIGMEVAFEQSEVLLIQFAPDSLGLKDVRDPAVAAPAPPGNAWTSRAGRRHPDRAQPSATRSTSVLFLLSKRANR